MNTEIKGRRALITGASKGIGAAIAAGLAQEGVNLCLVARGKERLEETANRIQKESGVSVFSIAADVSHADEIEKIYKFAESKLGGVDILINNSGGPKFGSFLSLSAQDWVDALDLILLSTVRMTTRAVPAMQSRKWGRIVTVTSTIAKEPTPTMVLSASARAGVTAFMKSIAAELAPQGVTSNVVAPGGVLTDRIRDLVKTKADLDKVPYNDLLKENETSIPLGRFATPEEFAAYVVFLCSEQARYITGTSLHVDGGLSKGAF